METRNQTSFIYLGGVALDEDVIINEKLLPGQKAGVGAIVVNIRNSGEFEQPYVFAVYQEQRYTVYLRYLFYEGELIDFGSGIEGGAYLFPRLIQEGQNVRVSPHGAALFLSPRNMMA